MRINAVMTGLVPVTHVGELPETFRSAGSGAAGMAGTSPAMTERADQEAHKRLIPAPMPLTPDRGNAFASMTRNGDAVSAPEGLP